MKHLISCSCGELQGEILKREEGIRAICYCKDCQIFAAFLGKTGEALDMLGGTQVVGLRQSNLRLTKGFENLSCVSLSEKGLLRWYAKCCNTPIGNTPRSPKSAHIGIIHSCIEGAPENLESVFGVLQIRVNRKSAKGPTAASKVGIKLLIKHALLLINERVKGLYLTTPFFSESGKPVSTCEVLSETKRTILSNTVDEALSRLS